MEEEIKFGKYRNYIGLHGSYINNVATREDVKLPASFLHNRMERDGADYHITVINPFEVRDLLSQRDESNVSKKQYMKSLVSKPTEQYGHPESWTKPIDLGMGICKDPNTQALSYYRVIHWPLGQNIRNLYGLKVCDFHITIGFHPKDVHLYKGPGSLHDLTSLSCSEARLKTLISLVPFYWNDLIFIKALYKQCVHLKSLKQAVYLSRVCILAFLRCAYMKLKNTFGM